MWKKKGRNQEHVRQEGRKKCGWKEIYIVRKEKKEIWNEVINERIDNGKCDEQNDGGGKGPMKKEKIRRL